MSSSTSRPVQSLPTLPSQPFRLDVPLHDLLQKPPEPSPLARVEHQPRTSLALPSPVFPQHPELLHEIDADDITAHETVLQTGKRHWPASKVMKTMRGWMLPYFKSRVLPGDFQPIIAYLFTEWKCNLDCHYCWSYDNRVKGMTEDTARRAIDWLDSTPCRVLAPTGGEPLLRPDFVHKVIYYAAKKGFWVYLATNARLLRPEVTDHLADAGIATINFAVDSIKEKPGLPKAFLPHISILSYTGEPLDRRRQQYSCGCEGDEGAPEVITQWVKHKMVRFSSLSTPLSRSISKVRASPRTAA